MHETYPNGVSEHAVQASAFGPDVLESLKEKISTKKQGRFIFSLNPDKSVVKNGPFWGKGMLFWWQYKKSRKSNSSAGQKSRKFKIG